MRKQIMMAFVSGMIVPVLLMAVLSRTPAQPQAETSIPTQTAPAQARTLAVADADGTVRQMELEDYLTGVVLAEMPASFPEEALKAQAVVARTYTCKRMASDKHDGASVCMDAGCCQGYLSPEDYLEKGGTEADLERIRQAVGDTAGLVLTYGGDLIDATYFSCSGGVTEDAVAVWGQDVPYLQSVESPGEEDAPRYSDTVRFTASQFRALTGCTGSGDPARWFGDTTYTDGGGVARMEICGETYTGVELRRMLGLRSTAFAVEVDDGEIIITTRGFGHRVGMSQYGARAMALAGSDYEEILLHYYTGTALKQMEGSLG